MEHEEYSIAAIEGLNKGLNRNGVKYSSWEVIMMERRLKSIV